MTDDEPSYLLKSVECLGGTLTRLYKLLELADYSRNRVSADEAARALRLSQQFVEAVRPREGGAMQ